MEKLYSVQDLCQRYGVKDFTVWEWIRTGNRGKHENSLF